MHSVHLLTCSRLGLQTDLLHTHMKGRGWIEEGREGRSGGGGLGGSGGGGVQPTAQHSAHGGAAASLLRLQYSRVLGIIDLRFLLIEQWRQHGSLLTIWVHGRSPLLRTVSI